MKKIMETFQKTEKKDLKLTHPKLFYIISKFNLDNIWIYHTLRWMKQKFFKFFILN